MKKAIPLIFILILVLVGVGIWYFLQSPSATASASALLPENTMAVARFYDLDKSINQLQTGRFAQKLGEIDIETVMAERDVSQDTIESLQEGIDDFLQAVNSQWFKELFGQDVLIAMMPVSVKDFTLHAAEDLLAGFILVARPKYRAEALGFISDLFADKTKVETFTYGEHEIKHFMVERNVPVYYSLVDGMLVGTLNQNTMQECLDRFDREGPSLDGNERYAGMIERLEQPHAKMLCYIDAEELSALLSRSIFTGVTTEEKQAPVACSLAGMKGLIDIGSAFYDDGTEILETRTLVSFDRSALDPLCAKAYGFAPEDNETLTMVAGEPLLYYWTNLFDLQMYWDFMMQGSLMEEQERAAVEANIQEQFGVSAEELFAALGNQAGVMLADINTSGFVPIPKLVLFIEARDPKVVEDIITSAVKRTVMQFQVEEYNGITIRSLPLPFGADVQPAYAFFKGFCLISINAQLIRDAIDTHNSGKGLAETPAFAAVDRKLSKKNNSVYFLDVKDSIEAAKAVIAWQQRMGMFRDPEKARESELVRKNVINPLLESLQVVQTIGSRAVLGEDELQGYAYIKVDRE